MEGFHQNILELRNEKIQFFYVCVCILRSTCRMTLIFSSLNRAELGEGVRYLEHGQWAYKKFSRAMESQTFPGKITNLEGFHQNIRNFEMKKSIFFTFASVYFSWL